MTAIPKDRDGYHQFAGLEKINPEWAVDDEHISEGDDRFYYSIEVTVNNDSTTAVFDVREVLGISNSEWDNMRADIKVVRLRSILIHNLDKLAYINLEPADEDDIEAFLSDDPVVEEFEDLPDIDE